MIKKNEGRSKIDASSFAKQNQHNLALMLDNVKFTSDNLVFEDRSGGDVDASAVVGNNDDGSLEGDFGAKVNVTRDRELIEFEQVGGRSEAFIIARDILEVRAEFDNGGASKVTRGIHDQSSMLKLVEVRLDGKQVGSGLDGQETIARHVNTVSVLEELNGSSGGSFELNHILTSNILGIANNVHIFQDTSLDNAFNGRKRHPQVVGVENLEFLDRLEILHVLARHLRNFEKLDDTSILNQRSSLNIRTSLISDFHQKLRLRFLHMLQNIKVDGRSKVINVGQENILLSRSNETIEKARVVERLEDVSVSRRIPLAQRAILLLRHGRQSILQDARIARLIESLNPDARGGVLLQNGHRVLVSVERVHQNQRHITSIFLVQVLHTRDQPSNSGNQANIAC